MQITPDHFVHGVDLIRRHLDQIGVASAALYGIDNDPALRCIQTVNSLQVGDPPDPAQHLGWLPSGPP